MNSEKKTEKSKEQKSPPAYFLSLTVENIRCFGPKQTIVFSDGNGRPAQWTVILGDNGTGKTTLLQCLAIIEPAFHRSPVKTMPKSFNRGTNESFISGTIIQSSKLKEHNEEKLTGNFKISNEYIYPVYPAKPSIMKVRAGPLSIGVCQKPTIDCNLTCYSYGAARRIGDASLADKEMDDPIASLFDDVALINAEEWLLQLDYAASKPSNIQQKFKKKLDQVKEILKNILPDVEDINITIPSEEKPNPTVEFKTDYGWVSMKNLSMGYKTMIAWIADLARRLFDRYPDSPDPIAEPAIVLIDEIDLHLHPKWQRDLMNFLSTRFINTQFIVTAHSPLVVQSVPGDGRSDSRINIVVLKQEQDHVVIKKEEQSVRGWRVDQLLASELFGVSTYPEELEKLLDERRKILGKVKIGRNDKKRLKELESQIGYLPTAEKPEDIEAMEIIRSAAQIYF